MRSIPVLTAIALCATIGAAADAQDLQSTRGLAATCAACHGPDGVSVGGVPPALARQDKAELLQRLKEFKAGTRPATVMHQLARGYSDEQLERIAAYFSAVAAGPAPAAPRAGD